MSEAKPEYGSYAVMFRTHFWDDFAARQYDRLQARMPGGRLFVLVDETNGHVEIDRPDVVRYTQDDLLALGLAKAGHGNMLWFSGDYSLYVFLDRHPDFTHYIMVEYDVTVNHDLDSMVERAAREAVDFIGLTTVHPTPAWNFTDGCLDVYRLEDIRQRLICIALFSATAARHLFDRRLAMSRDWHEGLIRRWPFCEAYIPTELEIAGYRMAELTDFGPADFYDWRPAFVETDLPAMRDQGFIHPVLDAERYIAHTMKHVWPPEGFFIPGSDVGRRIRRVPAGIYWQPLSRALRKRVEDGFRKRILGKPLVLG